MIYFVRDPSQGAVKIGFSDIPWARFSQIQSACAAPLSLFAVIEGDFEREQALHKQFHASRRRGEWFNWSPEIETFVASQPQIVRAPTRNPRVTEIRAVIMSMGLSGSYASRLLHGSRGWPLRIAVAVWSACGHKYGPIADAPDEDLRVLAKYAVYEQ